MANSWALKLGITFLNKNLSIFTLARDSKSISRVPLAFDMFIIAGYNGNRIFVSFRLLHNKPTVNSYSYCEFTNWYKYTNGSNKLSVCS